ncbi:hypothetical protein CHUAL_012745 [Chamberlinius hualienensis]
MISFTRFLVAVLPMFIIYVQLGTVSANVLGVRSTDSISYPFYGIQKLFTSLERIVSNILQTVSAVPSLLSNGPAQPIVLPALSTNDLTNSIWPIPNHSSQFPLDVQ